GKRPESHTRYFKIGCGSVTFFVDTREPFRLFDDAAGAASLPLSNGAVAEGMSLSSIVHQGLSKQVMEEANSYDQRYIPWNPPPYQHHAPQCNAYQSKGFGDAYYGYEDPLPPYRPSQNGIEEALQLLCQERKELWEAQK
ncbi:hypothetical protein PIB30_077402, partial [Stylosanthes scabra]|nr:hypothetical protein [Stylosanthes scabra]